MTRPYHVIDLFAGPGGLAEGFCASRDESGRARFRIDLSIERDVAAHRTLRTRALFRRLQSGKQAAAFSEAYFGWLNGKTDEPDWSGLFPTAWQDACDEALCLELGNPQHDRMIDKRIDAVIARGHDRCVVIGGPPCQAYSLAGRSRNMGVANYRPENDQRHFLYREYIRILGKVNPVAFVMENVKGLTSSSVGGKAIGEQILRDLETAGTRGTGYTLLALGKKDQLSRSRPVSMNDFIVRCEDWGLPQARHRVIIVGVRSDLVSESSALRMFGGVRGRANTEDMLTGLPALRSGLSRESDTDEAWSRAISEGYRKISCIAAKSDRPLAAVVNEYREKFESPGSRPGRSSAARLRISASCPPELADWIADDRLLRAVNHETRGHIAEDLQRYLFATLFAKAHGRSPKAPEFPAALAPTHGNWNSGKFADRFRVQVASRPSTTITSHISKDGHYFIHPDPLQCRSLTVREAARLQTFPDNYVFLGNRTQQYVQVGNAVPPFLARDIASALWSVLEQSSLHRNASVARSHVSAA